MWCGMKGESGFSASDTGEKVTEGIDGSALTCIITGFFLSDLLLFCLFLHVCMHKIYLLSKLCQEISFWWYSCLLKLLNGDQEVENIAC